MFALVILGLCLSVTGTWARTPARLIGELTDSHLAEGDCSRPGAQAQPVLKAVCASLDEAAQAASGRSVEQSPSSNPAPQDDEPEEPDFAFIAGGPFTQKKNSIQFIQPSRWSRRRSGLNGSTLERTEFGTLLRTEWGFTDRLELDVITLAEGERERVGGTRFTDNFSMADSVVGVRYRFLQEFSSPFTLTMGPQVIIPSGSFPRGTGFDTVGFAWDAAAAKDWGGPVFLLASLNYSVFPSVKALTPGSSKNFTLQNFAWATAVGLRPLEKPRGASHHDIHVFLEFGQSRDENLEPGFFGGTKKVSEFGVVFAPGIRYGFLTRTKKLFEIGVSFPLGLNQNTPRGGLILQIQFESIFGYRPD